VTRSKPAATLGDLIAVPPVRTVIRLSDLRYPERGRELVETFVLTREAEEVLTTVLRAVTRGQDQDEDQSQGQEQNQARGQGQGQGLGLEPAGGQGQGRGQGFFLQGNYGSGKSHLLSVLSLLLEQPEAWSSLPGLEETALAPLSPAGAGTNGTHGLREEKASWPPAPPSGVSGANTSANGLSSPRVQPGRYLVLNISLVEHSGGEYLEDVFFDHLRRKLQERTGVDPGLDLKGEFVREMARVVQERYLGPLETFCREKGLAGPHDLFQVRNSALVTELLEFLGLPYRPLYQREAAWRKATDLLRERGFFGLVVILDELSEFLRSEPDSRHFNEDIRFLQFLGEAAQTYPCWIVASLQERIEDTGEVYPEVFRKIADRYPVRFQLTGRHLREIITRRLIQHREGAREFAQRRYQDLRAAFGTLPFGQDDFVDLYPVHPLTVEFLEALKPLLSQERGAVDFIHYQLKGDPSRQIAGLLQEPPETLLGPDRIFDHFFVRLRERQETRRYIEEVFAYFEREIPNIFQDPEDRQLARRAIKVLILAASSPAPWRLSLRQLAFALLYPITELEVEVNYAHLRDLLQTMAAGGMYLAVEKAAEKTIGGRVSPESFAAAGSAGGEKPTPAPVPARGTSQGQEKEDSWAERYYLDLSVDVGEIIRQKVRFLAAGFYPADRRFLEKLVPWIDDRELPLAGLVQERRQVITTRWNNTRREGLLLLLDLSELSLNDLKELTQRVATTETDFVLILGEPSVTPRAEKVENLLRATLWPELAHLGAAEAFRFWLPQPWPDEELLRQALAHLLLWEEYQGDASPLGQQVRDYLGNLLPQWRQKVQAAFRQAYLSGKVYTGSGKLALDPGLFGLIPWNDLLDRIVFPVLRERFPRHQDCAPQSELLLPAMVGRTLEGFLLPGKTTVASMDPLLRQGVEGFLKPLRLVVKEAGEYRLELDPERSPALKELLATMDEEQVGLEELYWHLRKGPLGLTREAFTFLVLALLASGTLSARRNERRVDPAQITADNFWKIETLVREEELSAEDLVTLAQLDFLGTKLTRGPLTASRRRELWEQVVTFKRNTEAELEWLKGQLRLLGPASIPAGKEELAGFFSAGGVSPLAGLPFERILRSIDQLEEVLGEIKVTFGPREGLSRFLHAYRQSPFFEKALTEVGAWLQFFRTDLEDLLFIHHYLSFPALVLPGEEPWGGLQKEREHLRAAFQEEALYMNPERRQKLRADFEDFRRHYIELYVAEHRRQLGSERFSYLERLRHSPLYHLLEELAGLEFIPGRDWAGEISQLVEQALARRCDRVDEKSLLTQPVCQCGWKPGEKVELPPAGEIQRQLEDGLLEYLRNLREPTYAVRILSFARGLEETGKEKLARALRELIGAGGAGKTRTSGELFGISGTHAEAPAELPSPGRDAPLEGLWPEAGPAGEGRPSWEEEPHLDGGALVREARPLPSLERLQRLLIRPVIDAINDALRGRVILVERDLDDLYRRLHQRRLPAAELRRVFEDWLTGGSPLAPDLLIKVKGGRRLSQSSDQGVFSPITPVPPTLPTAPPTTQTPGAVAPAVTMPQAALPEVPPPEIPMAETGTAEAVTPGAETTGTVTPKITTVGAFRHGPWRALAEETPGLSRPLTAGERRAWEQVLAKHILNYAPAELEEDLERLVGRGSRTDQELSGGIRPGTVTGRRAGESRTERPIPSALAEGLILLRDLRRLAAEKDFPTDFSGWEKVYARALGDLDLRTRSFLHWCRLLELDLPDDLLRQEGEVTRRRYREAFQTFYGQFQDEEMPGLASLLKGPVRRLVLETEPETLYLVLLDGLRYDLWRGLWAGIRPGEAASNGAGSNCKNQVHGPEERETTPAPFDSSGVLRRSDSVRLAGRLGRGLRLLEEGFIWASYPTTTEVQLEVWRKTGAFGGEVKTVDAEDKMGISWRRIVAELGNDPLAQPRFLLRFGFADDKIHASRDDLLTLSDEVIRLGRRLVGGFLAALPPGSLAVFFADHGFRENPAYVPFDKTSSRYLHGGNWPEEVLAPWAIILKEV